jgi:hypothetical protein
VHHHALVTRSPVIVLASAKPMRNDYESGRR